VFSSAASRPGRGRLEPAARLVTALAVLTTGLLAAAPRAGASVQDDRALTERYAPVVRVVDQPAECGPGEPFVPTDVDRLFGDDGVALRGPWTTDDLVTIGPSAADLGKGLDGYHLDFPGDPLNPGCTYEQWARTLTSGSKPTTYARVVTEPGRSGLAVQYWLYYPFNDFNNKHESDWEMLQVEFAASDAATALGQRPTRVGYSQHEGVELAGWDDLKLQLVDATHPVVYPAAGSHANYYEPALFLGRSGQQGFGCDDTRGPSRDLRPELALVPTDSTAAADQFPWLGFTGRWGQREASFYNGPTGPNTKDQWTHPLTWSDDEGVALSYAVPASGLFGTQATSSFCGIVQTGSDLLRLGLARPALTLLALTVVALLVAWLVRRTTWRPSAPLRLGRRRSTGQVVASVWRMYLRRFPLFVGIGTPIAVATVLPGVAQVWLTALAESTGGGPLSRGLALVAGLLLTLLAPLTLLLGQAAVMHSVCEIDAGRTVGVRSAYAAALRRGIPLVVTLVAVSAVVLVCALTVVLVPVGLVVLVGSLLVIPVIVLEGRGGWPAVRRSGQLVRPRWVKVVVLVAVTTALVLSAGPVLGTALILVTSLPFVVSNAIAGIVYALLVPISALNTVYVWADAVVSDALDPRQEKVSELPAEAVLR
jgi:hypothetical protein